ncbi:hypothetical protein EQJ94_24255 [Escherichia coli]|nr:hypothetical protein [Escherichia coli]
MLPAPHAHLQSVFVVIILSHDGRLKGILSLLSAYSALFDHGFASKSDQRFAYFRSTGNLTFSTAF